MKRAVVVAVVACALVLGACGDDSDTDGRGLSGTVTVLAASSLTGAFEELAGEFEDRHPGVDIETSFAASSELAAQIQQGAPADVFASADESNMDKVVESGDVDTEPVVFARNRLTIAVEQGNPQDIAGMPDLARDDLVVVLCAEQVPCGKFADQALDAAGVSVSPASREENVKAALGKVELGEADAAIVYVTDVLASGEAEAVDIPDDQNVIAVYPIAPLAEATPDDAAAAFVDFVVSRAGQAILREFGFLPP